MSALRPLYGLKDIVQTPLGAERVFLVEGEKACDAARAIGLLATTSAGGSAAPQHTEQIRQRGLLFVPIERQPV